MSDPLQTLKPDAMLHPDLHAPGSTEGEHRNGRRLDHAEGNSKPLRAQQPEQQPRGAKIRGNRPVDQSEAANRFIAATVHEKMHDERLWDLRQKRDREMHGLPEWEELRDLASAIKEHTLAHLDRYLEQFEAAARANGVHVHWARDAGEHNRIVLGILRGRGAKRLIKSKSMLTEECGFREFMAEHAVEVIETDLGERIQQLDGEAPSHVVVPAVHKLRTDVARVFAKKLGSDPATQDVHVLAETQRDATRPLILSADAGMTGCNFAVAETGTVVVCTNEGNADLSANTPPMHIVSMGIEKLVPRLEHLAVMVRLLSRSALGSPMTQYTSHFRGPRAGGQESGGQAMSGRGDILGAVRAHLPKVDRPDPLVPLFDAGAPPDLLAAFGEQLERMGGEWLTPGADDPLAPVRAKLASAKVVCSHVPEVAGNKALGAGMKPTDLADVDYGVVRAAFAVAETGSVCRRTRGWASTRWATCRSTSSSCSTRRTSCPTSTMPTAARNGGSGTTPCSTPAPPPRPTSRAC